jgi:hypothetical protein
MNERSILYCWLIVRLLEDHHAIPASLSVGPHAVHAEIEAGGAIIVLVEEGGFIAHASIGGDADAAIPLRGVMAADAADLIAMRFCA